MNINTIKRRYLEMRFGNQMVGPVIQLANFIMIAYLAINEFIPIYIFAPMFVMGIILAYVLVGNKFRKVQQTTDLDLGYEKSRQSGKTVYQMMSAQLLIMDHFKLRSPIGFVERMEYMRKIGDGEL